MGDIYQDIWNADQMGNGVPALRPGEALNEAVGYVIVDERATAVGSEHRVLKEVEIPASKKQTYALCEKLFDNYALERAAGETVRIAETQEELNFIDAIVATPPIQSAREHLQESLGLQISDEILVAMIKETWFDMGSVGSQHDASGFEHVFVGEQASSTGKIGGYHFWYKYYLDEGGQSAAGAAGQDLIQYHGTKYHGAMEPEEGVLIPEIVTLSLTWEAPGGDSDSNGRTLTKPIGGFFVGCSPECLVALGLVRCRTKSGKIAKINGAEYLLDLHRLDGRPNSIRTFFPRFRRADVIDIGPTEPPPVTPEPVADLPFRIVAAMVNPINPEGGREFVQIINTSNRRQGLLKWRVVAPNGTGFDLADISVDPGEIFKFQIPKNEGVLRNKAGEIRLLNPSGILAQSCAYSSDDAAREGAPILFLRGGPGP